MIMIFTVSQYVVGFTRHSESMLIGLFRQRQFADERKWLFVSADVCGAGTRNKPLRTSAWEANQKVTDLVYGDRHFGFPWSWKDMEFYVNLLQEII